MCYIRRRQRNFASRTGVGDNHRHAHRLRFDGDARQAFLFRDIERDICDRVRRCHVRDVAGKAQPITDAEATGFRFELGDGRLEVFKDRTSLAVWIVHNTDLQLVHVDGDVSYSTGDVDDAVLKTAEVLQEELRKSSASHQESKSYRRSA